MSLITLIQKVDAGSGTSSLGFPQNNTAGNLLVCGIIFSTTGISTPTDTAGNTWLDCGAGEVDFNGASVSVKLFYVANCKAGSNTVTSTGAFSVHLAEFSGVLASSPIEATSKSPNNSTTSGTSPGNMLSSSFSPPSNGDLIVCLSGCITGPISSGPGFITASDVNGLLSYLVQGLSNTINPAHTDATGSDAYGTIAAAFKPAGPTTTVGNVTSYEGQTATFTTSVIGNGSLTYQWYRNAGSIGGATSSSYTTPALTYTTNNGDTYYCAVTDDNGTVNSASAALAVLMAATPCWIKA
jgi:hypothetical protein